MNICAWLIIKWQHSTIGNSSTTYFHFGRKQTFLFPLFGNEEAEFSLVLRLFQVTWKETSSSFLACEITVRTFPYGAFSHRRLIKSKGFLFFDFDKRVTLLPFHTAAHLLFTTPERGGRGVPAAAVIILEMKSILWGQLWNFAQLGGWNHKE